MLEKFFRVCVRVKFLIGEKEREREKKMQVRLMKNF